MIIAHLADLHLGYRAYHRMAPGGINVRERDVARAFRVALDRVVELDADLVLVAGDLFHTVRPSNRAITDAFRQFLRLHRLLPDAPVVLISGNHDSPRSVETGSILRLLGEIPNVHVVDDEARRVELEALDTSVLCVPHAALLSGAPIEYAPSRDVAVNVLMIHGTVTGAGVVEKLRIIGEYGGARVELSDIRPERWDYVALGHYHNRTEIAPNTHYAGALERCSANVWDEATVEKGFLTFDTTSGEAEFHAVPTRPVLDLPPVRGRDRDGEWVDPEELDAAIRDRIAGIDELDGAIVRLVIRDVSRELFRQLDHRRIREWRAEALHLHLDARRPEIQRSPVPGREARRTLDEEVEAHLNEWTPSTGDIRTARLLELARHYLAEAAAAEPAPGSMPLLEALEGGDGEEEAG